jgi:hypothetical protein
MWSTDAPFKLDSRFWGMATPPQMPTPQDEVFLKASEDFLGTMNLARNALALTRYCYEHRNHDPILDDEELFWEYRAAASLWLSTSSDRILDYFVMARFGITSPKDLTKIDGYNKFEPQSKFFTRVFGFPGEEYQGQDAKEAHKKLHELARQLDGFRLTRNEIVHEIASRRGHNAQKSLKYQREKAEQVPYVPRKFDHSKEGLATLAETSRLFVTAKQAELQEALSKLKEWYSLLVKAASLVFEFEYWKRIGK